MAQQPFTRKESPEKDFKHSPEPGTSPRGAYGAGSVLPSQGRMPEGTTSSPVDDKLKGCPQITFQDYPGTTAKYTITDIITHQQAVDAGQKPPKPDLPEEAIRKAKLMGIVHVPDEELEELRREDAEKRRSEAAASGSHTFGSAVIHPAPGADAPGAHSPMHGTGKTSDEAATQSKYDNRGGGEEGKR